MRDIDLDELLSSWLVSLAADGKSPETVKSYANGVRGFLAWCARHGYPSALDKPTARAWVADLLAGGAEPATARARQLALRRFSAWCAEEGETAGDELAGLKPPKLDTKVVDPLSEEELKALLGACEGKGFRERRDTAIVRVMLETAARASEVTGMTLAGTDVKAGTVLIARGKGAKGRRVPFSAKTAQAIDRYLRTRRGHRLASTNALWLGDRGKELGYYGLHSALRHRAELAGVEGFRPHRLRHTAATRWLARGGSEGGLMAVAGWSRREMLDRYTAATAADRAAEEARSLGLGDI